jgi:hypothetical protein
MIPSPFGCAPTVSVDRAKFVNSIDPSARSEVAAQVGRRHQHFEARAVTIDFCELLTVKSREAAAYPLSRSVRVSYSECGEVARYTSLDLRSVRRGLDRWLDLVPHFVGDYRPADAPDRYADP